jgi:hypothetical protein
VTIDQVSLAYSHQGNPSLPRLQVRFTNASRNSIAKVVFQLSLLDSSGYLHDYPDNLTFNAGLGQGKKGISNWTLHPESVDIHRAGEVVVVKKVAFMAGNQWADDGSQSCKFVVDFHAR